MKKDDVYALFSRPIRTRKCVLSVFLNVDQSTRDNLNRGFETRLKEMASSLRKSVKESPEHELLAAALHRATDFVSAYVPEGRGLAVFVDEADGFFTHKELAFPVTNQIRWDSQLLLQPLANALDQLEDYGIALMDRTKLRLFHVQQGKIEEVLYEDIKGRRTRHVKSTGPDHAESSDRNQRRADNQIRANLREVLGQVNKFVNANRLQRLVLAGTPETLAEFRKLLPARLALSVIGQTALGMDTSPARVLSVAQPLADAYERATEVEKVNDVLTTAAKKGKAVVGLGHTLQAVNSDRAWELIYSAGFHAAGFECTECSALFMSDTPSCAYCGSKVQPLDNVVERVVEHAVRKQAKVEVVVGEASAALNAAGGIGALLRTRTKAVVAV